MAVYLRDQVGYKPPKKPLTVIPTVDTIFIHHSVTDPTSDPLADARKIQQIHFGRGYSDVAYTIFAHPNGDVIEGRVLNSHATIGAHTVGWNSKSIAVCAIGNYETNLVTPTLIDAINRAIEHAIVKGWALPKSRIRPHSDVFATACCGKYLKEKLNLLGAPVSADKLTREEVIVLHEAEFGGPPGTAYDYRHAGGPLGKLLADWHESPLTLRNQKKAGTLIDKKDCPATPNTIDIDGLAEAVADKLAARLKE